MGIIANFITHQAVEITRFSSGQIAPDGGLQEGIEAIFNMDLCIQPSSQ